MGGGDLNMKKSWHPLLQKNQERVWQEENKAREERKRIEQKRKEIAEERQLQELQRLQEVQGGKPRQERLDWMYTAPGSGGQAVSEQLEQYLLGKKGVQDLIMGDENEKLKKGGDLLGFIAGGNANTVTDTRNKVLNDPLLAIKKQEQRKYEELMNNPLLLKKMKREMDKVNGVKEDGERKKHKHHHHRSEKRHRDRDEDDSRSRHREDRHRSERRSRDDDYRSEKRRRSDEYQREDDYRSSSRRDSGGDKSYRRRDEERNDRSDHSREYDHRRRDRSPYDEKNGRSERSRDYDDRRRDRSPYRSSRRRSLSIKRESTPPRQHSSRPRSPPVKREPSPSEEERAAALKAMLSNADELESSRAIRLAALEAKEKEDLQREEEERLRKKGFGGRAGFMKDMQGQILERGKVAPVR